MGEFMFGSFCEVLFFCRKYDEDRDMCCEDCKIIFCVMCGQIEYKEYNWGSIKKILFEKWRDIFKISQVICGCVQEIIESFFFVFQMEYE